MRKLISLISLFFSISFLLIFFSTCTDNIQSATDINQTPEIPLVYENDELLYSSEDIKKLLISNIDGIDHVKLSKFELGFLQLSLEDENHRKVDFKFSWSPSRTFFSAFISGFSNYHIEFDQNNDDATLSMWTDKELLILYRFNSEDRVWQQREGKYTDEKDLENEHSIFANIYSPIVSVLIEYVKNPKNISPEMLGGVADIKESFNSSCTQNIPLSMMSTVCTGTYHDAVAYGYNILSCCTNATQKVHGSCTNAYCIGCCQEMCSPYCGFMSQYCICDAYGKSCGLCDSMPGHPDC